MKIISLEKAGWKKVCPLEEPYLNNIQDVLSFGKYKTVKTDKQLLCQPLKAEDASVRNLISISSRIDEFNYSDKEKIIYSQNFFSENPYIHLQKTYIGDPKKFNDRFLEGSGFESFKTLMELATLASPKQILDILNNYVVPSFFKKHQKGRIYFIKCDDLLANMNAVARSLSTIDIFGADVMKKNKKQEIPHLLRGVHQPFFDAFIDNALKAVFFGFFPCIYGFVSSRIGGYILFLLDKPIKFEPERINLDYFREDGIFDDVEGRKNIEELWELVEKGEIDYREVYKRYIHEKEFSTEEIDRLINWTIKQISDFYIKILDFCNFYNENNFIDFALQRKIFLTLERIFLEINNIIFSNNSFARKILYFDLHDKLSSLVRLGSQKQDKIFKRLLRFSHFDGKIKEILEDLPSPFNKYIIEYGKEIYLTLIKHSFDHIWDNNRKSEKGIQLREIDEEARYGWIGKKYKEMNTKISDEEYAVNLLHEFRNTLHGYILRDYKFEKYLSVHRGIISDYLPDLSLVWLFVMLSDISKVLNSEITKTNY